MNRRRNSNKEVVKTVQERHQGMDGVARTVLDGLSGTCCDIKTDKGCIGRNGQGEVYL